MAKGKPTPRAPQNQKPPETPPGPQFKMFCIGHDVSVVSVPADPDTPYMCQGFHGVEGSIAQILFPIDMAPPVAQNMVKAMKLAQEQGEQQESGLIIASPGQEKIEAERQAAVKGDQ